jgi:hypothetical protein
VRRRNYGITVAGFNVIPLQADKDDIYINEIDINEINGHYLH